MHTPAATPEAEIGALLRRAGVQLALVESGTRGAVARILSSTAEGRRVLTAADRVDTPAELAARLGLSTAKLAAFGWLSPMVAAEAAAALIDTYEGGWGLAVLAPAQGGAEADAAGSAQACVALGTPSATLVESCAPAAAPQLALTLLRREAAGRLAASQGEKDSQ